MKTFSLDQKKSHGASVAANKRDVMFTSNKFKLCPSKDSVLSRKPTSRETKPKAKFISTATAISTKKQNKTKPSLFATNSLMRPQSTGVSLPKSSGFSLKNFQSKAEELEKKKVDLSKKTPRLAFATKPLIGKFSVNPKPKSTLKAKTEAGQDSKIQTKGNMPFGFHASAKSSVKKRKILSSCNLDKQNTFPNKIGRTKPDFTLKPLTRSKEQEHDKQKEITRVGSTHHIAPCASEVNKGRISKDNAFSVEHKVLVTSMAYASKEKGDRVIKSSKKTGNAMREEDAIVPVPSLQAPLKAVPASKAMQSNAVPLLPDYREECLEEELAIKLTCTVDNDTEDEFLRRTAALQDFTDRIGLEQKQICNRLVNIHADISESLLDALTDLMAEEGGIGIDKLNCDVNIDFNLDEDFLQNDKIEVVF